MAAATSSFTTLQRIVFNSVDFSFMLQPVKSVIAAMLKHCKDQAKLGEEINITMNEAKMPVVKEVMHMGISKSEDSQESAVPHNTEKARRIVYSLMSAGFHGDNELDPYTSIHLLQTYISYPRL